MRLTQPQRLKLGRLLKERVGDFPACPVCRNASGWLLPSSFLAAPAWAPEEGEPAGVPLVAITCNQCGHVLLFHAARLGLLDDELPSDQTG